jgi:hypothetical protein
MKSSGATSSGQNFVTVEQLIKAGACGGIFF